MRKESKKASKEQSMASKLGQELATVWAQAHWGNARAIQGILDRSAQLIEAGASVTERDSNWGAAPLHGAARSGSKAGIELLLAAGADPDQENRDGETPLMLAAKSACLGGVKKLLAAGAKVNATRRGNQSSALLEAAHSGAKGEMTIKALLEAGADPSQVNSMGMSALELAAQSESKESVQALWTAHEWSDPVKRNAAALSLYQQNASIALWMIEQGGLSLSGPGKSGQTLDLMIEALESGCDSESWTRMASHCQRWSAEHAKQMPRAIASALVMEHDCQESLAGSAAIEWVERSAPEGVARVALTRALGHAEGRFAEQGVDVEEVTVGAMRDLRRRVESWMEKAELSEPGPEKRARKKQAL